MLPNILPLVALAIVDSSYQRSRRNSEGRTQQVRYRKNCPVRPLSEYISQNENGEYGQNGDKPKQRNPKRRQEMVTL